MFLADRRERFSPELNLSDRWIRSPFGTIYLSHYQLYPGILQWVSGPQRDLSVFLWVVAHLAQQKGWRTFPFYKEEKPGFFQRIKRLFSSTPSQDLPRPFPLLPEKNGQELMKVFRGDADLCFLDGNPYLDPDFVHRQVLGDLLVREVLQRGRTVIFFSPRPPYDECPWDERYLIERGVLHPVAEELRSLPF